MTSTFVKVSDIGVCLGLSLRPPANAGVRSKRGAVHRYPESGQSRYSGRLQPLSPANLHYNSSLIDTMGSDFLQGFYPASKIFEGLVSCSIAIGDGRSWTKAMLNSRTRVSHS